MRIYDKDGIPRDWAWLRQQFGAVEVREGQGPWHCVELRESEGPAVIVVTVRDRNGDGIDRAFVARWWPDPHLSGLPSELASWHDQGVFGETNANGDIGFAMGQGDYYFPPSGGASEVWTDYGGDLVKGLGMLGGTNHRHLNVVFQDVGDEPEPEPEPPPPPPPPEPEPEPEPEPPTDFEALVLDRLDRIIELLESE